MVDFDDAAHAAVAVALGRVPEAGDLLAGLVGLFWPSDQPDVWDSIRARVEALIDQKIATFEYQTVREDLTGLKSLIGEYTVALTSSANNPEDISNNYGNARAAFETDLPHFQAEGYELLLLPLFVQFANLHLALLRDGATFGANWWSGDLPQLEETKLQATIQSYGTWVQTWYAAGLAAVPLPGDTSRLCENWQAQNTYTREMTFTVLDHAYYWPLFDPRVHPAGTPVAPPTRTIYSDPIGSACVTGIILPVPPIEPITAINIWAWNSLDAIQVNYGGVSGQRQGDQPSGTFGGSLESPHGWAGTVDTDKNPIVEVSGQAFDRPNTVQLSFKDGTSTNVCGTPAGYNGYAYLGYNYSYSYPGHVLGSIIVMGINPDDGTANGMVLGFRIAGSFLQGSWITNPLIPAPF
jgi:hypothetical protein